MKNHIVIKFIAIVLCAAALLGAVGSGLGILLLTEEDLYDKTVDQVHRQEQEDLGKWFADAAAHRYADIELGGCPYQLVDQYYQADALNGGYYSYKIIDAEGNVLKEEDALNSGVVPTTSLSYPISGKYQYLVSAVPESKRFAHTETTERIIPCTAMALDSGPFDLIPGETLPLDVDVEPEDTTDQIRYYSLNESIATVDETGLITAVTEGQTRVIVTCGNFTHELGVYISAPPTEPPVPETAPATEPFVYDAWDEETWERIQAWIQEEWNKDTWENDQWDAMAAWATENWKEDEWNDAQWAQLHHWIVTEWNQAEPAALTVPQEAPTEEVTTGEGPTEAAEAPAAEAAEATEATEATEAAVAETAPDETVPATVPPEALDESVDSAPPETIGAVTESEASRPETINGRPLSEYQLYTETIYDHWSGESIIYEYALLDMPEMTVELQLAPGAINMDAVLPLLRILHAYRNYLFVILAVSLLLFAVTGVYLICAAGRKPKSDEIRAGGLNRMPLELHLLFSGSIITALVLAVVEGGEYLIRKDLFVGCAFMAAAAYVACLVAVCCLFALAAQLKTPGWFWLKNSLCGLCWRIAVWMWHKLFPLCVHWGKVLWDLALRILSWCWKLALRCLNFIWAKLCAFGHWLERIYAMLPLIWQWLVIGLGLILLPFFFLVLEADFMMFLVVAADIALIVYGALSFGTLLDGTKRMSQGDLNTKVDDSRLIGSFKEFAHNLNALADVAIVAAQKQLKSERMKTELITNVSHDIKTPLTSIINYVDLLQKAETEEEREQYLEVLDRQSQQLKKLIEDLIEMSKASTGNMTVDIARVDAVEAVNQALGEFSDKLDKAQLTPVFRHSEGTAPMMADGKLVWRVLHNLLSNAVKYALPGTRLYVDLMQVEGKVILSMKNVSREELNIDAEELMERFVRGDDSRNTEGSGLGLNIAKSMMELQKGQMELLVDGDLFKVTLIFPGV